MCIRDSQETVFNPTILINNMVKTVEVDASSESVISIHEQCKLKYNRACTDHIDKKT